LGRKSSAGHGAVAAGETIIPRRTPRLSTASTSRHAALPVHAAGLLAAVAQACGEPAPIAALHGPARSLRYAPDFLGPDQALRTAGDSAASPAWPAAAGGHEFNRAHFESLFARAKDPWRYTSDYEQRKYEQTLSLIPPSADHALEVACAEGHFTMQLAPRVKHLKSVDISQLAVAEAARRCSHLPNVEFAQHDLVQDPVEGSFDVIVCSEVLYYVGGVAALKKIARKFSRALKPGGRLVMAHAHLVVDEPDRPGFGWNLPFGAKRIGEIIARAGGLKLAREIRTPLYRVQAFERPRPSLIPFWNGRKKAEIEIMEQPTALPPDVAAQVLWKGGKPGQESAQITTSRLPILMYHRVAPEGSPAARRWRVTPAQFEEQLRYLADCGYYSPSLANWQHAAALKRPLPGRATILTFDDGFRDFNQFARPLLKRYGFSACLFAVTDRVGQTNAWDTHLGEAIELLTWDELKELQQAGFTIGSHTCTHPALSALPPAQMVNEFAASREKIARQLGGPVDAIAYPYGDTDPVIAHLAGAVGYRFGLSCHHRLAAHTDDLLLLPRLEVSNSQTFAEFVHALDHPAS
jgi:peptidoglycan/xylan/chitin deacetylase (PgdA/CDA1 family)